MAAIDTFFGMIAEGHLPAAIPVESSDGGRTGLAATGMVFRGNASASEIVLSPDPGHRAVAAIFAVQRTMEIVRQDPMTLVPQA